MQCGPAESHESCSAAAIQCHIDIPALHVDLLTIIEMNKLSLTATSQHYLSSCSFVEGLIKAEESSGIPSNRTLIAGFSQGGAVSLLMLRSQIKLAAVLAMSTWLPLADEQPILSSENKQTPVLMCHGNIDQVVGAGC